MRTDIAKASPWWRRLAHAAIMALGVIVIVGSGGGSWLPDWDFSGSFPLSPSASIEPARATVQVGATVTFTVSTIFGNPPLSYQWRRNGVDIAGETGTTYTRVGANLGDDGAEFSVVVTASNGIATAASVLRVSSLPGVAFQDGDFPLSGWAVTAIVDPSQNGPTHSESRSATGGNPDAFRSVTYQLPQGSSSVRVFHTALASTYDPAVQGAIYTIDFAQDCTRLSTSIGSETYVSPAFEQGGRWFAPQQWDSACVVMWQTRRVSSLRADEFALVAGSACRVDEACPDFSAGAAPVRFGFISGVNLPPDAAAGSITQGIDNWNVTVWRR